MFYNPSFVRKKDGAETKANRMRFLLNFITGNPEGYSVDFIIAWASINIGLSPKKTLEYLGYWETFGSIKITDGFVKAIVIDKEITAKEQTSNETSREL